MAISLVKYPGGQRSEGGRAPFKCVVARPFGRAPLLVRGWPVHRNRLAATGKAIGFTIGFSTQVIAVFAELLHPSDRGCSTQVTVDKSAYPKGLRTAARLPAPPGGRAGVTK